MNCIVTGSSGLVGGALVRALNSRGDNVTRLLRRAVLPAKKNRILASRVNSTSTLAGALAKLRRRPRVLVCASAIGYYGHRADETLTETSAAGHGFLAEVCQAGEGAAAVVRLALGEMADELLLACTRVLPAALTRAGFEFHYPELKESLHALLP